MEEFERDRDLLIRLWRLWAKRAAELSDEQWTTETRLPGWTVRDVYVHVTPDVLIAMLAAPAADGDVKVTSAAEMLRVFNADRPRPNRCTRSSPRWFARWRPTSTVTASSSVSVPIYPTRLNGSPG
ncbi:hypothetical protein GS943_17260 [Rhodococcus hoagii]|nr:hypothetical protein [Prescottella equi]